MQFRHAPDGDFSAVASGHVLHSVPGAPAFPVRLALELLARCLTHRRDPGEPVTLWDPCCGAGGLVVTLGLLARDRVRAVVAGDVDAEVLAVAARNLALLHPDGLRERATHLDGLAAAHGKAGHESAAVDARRLAGDLARHGPLPAHLGPADALSPESTRAALDGRRPDVVVADVPHGRAVDWAGRAREVEEAPEAALLLALAAVLDPGAVVAVCARARRVSVPAGTRVLERLRHGHRAAVLVRAGDVPGVSSR